LWVAHWMISGIFRQAHVGKPVSSVDAGAVEIRIKDAAGIYRVIYVASFEEAIYVLHAFEKKTQKTRKADIALARARYKALAEERKRI